MYFLLKNHHLHSNQFGFHHRSSTQEALLSVTNYWHLALSSCNQVATVFFDIKTEAFDSVPHDQLILSLSQMGITGSLLHWFTNRKQRVVLDGFSSSSHGLTPNTQKLTFCKFLDLKRS